MTDIPTDVPGEDVKKNNREFVGKAKYGDSPATSASEFKRSSEATSQEETSPKTVQEMFTVPDIKGCKNPSEAALTWK